MSSSKKPLSFKLAFLIGICIVLNNSVTQAQNSQKDAKIFTNINEALKNPEKVLRLKLDDTSVDDFSDLLSKFKNLEYLSLHNDHLKKLPKDIGNLSKLRVLDLSNNDLRKLPKSFSKLKDLEVLNLAENPHLKLKSDLKIISQLQNLKEFHLEGDAIRTLPSSIADLESLERLYLSDNRLEHIPESLINLKNLTLLQLDQNSIPSNEIEEFQHNSPKVKVSF